MSFSITSLAFSLCFSTCFLEVVLIAGFLQAICSNRAVNRELMPYGLLRLSPVRRRLLAFALATILPYLGGVRSEAYGAIMSL